MERFKGRPLKTLELASRPLGPHALAWSCDAELAVGTEDALYIFLPEYPRIGQDVDANDRESVQPQFSLSLRAAGIVRPDPAINGQLCASAGVDVPAPNPDDASFKGVGAGGVTASGGAVSQPVRLEWSPSGVGCNSRPILGVMLTNGGVVMLGENIERHSNTVSSLRARSFKCWKILWGLGARLPIPDGGRASGFRYMNERIVSFSWAKEIGTGKAMLAYMNDRKEVALVAVQFLTGSRDGANAGSEEEQNWQVEEVVRFDASGPHEEQDILDPDYVPSGSVCSLKWSPWLASNGSRTATLAYIAPNHVAFRRVTLHEPWDRGQSPKVDIEQWDTASICLALGTDAFVEWEDAIWNEEGAHVGRGFIATPFVAKPFQVPLDGPLGPPADQHFISQCSPSYEVEEEVITNPITGLIVHHPYPSTKPSVPLYSLTRLSATATNQDWYQTSLLEADEPLPQWAADIGRQTARLVSQEAALGGYGFDTDSDDSEDELAEPGKSGIKLNLCRFRIWGLASSPGDGCTAVVVSKHSTLHPSRIGTSKVMFGWREPPQQDDDDSPVGPARVARTALTTEGGVWEWLYGLGKEVPGTLGAKGSASRRHRSDLRDALFGGAEASQSCVFCGGVLQSLGDEARCENNHSFATCAATGLAVMRPGISRVCAVCGLRCLKVSELAKIAREHLGSDAEVKSMGEVCGGCGGKFVV